MKLYLDGRETPWPSLIEIVLDEPVETVGPLEILVRNGRLRIQGRDGGAGLTIHADRPDNGLDICADGRTTYGPPAAPNFVIQADSFPTPGY